MNITKPTESGFTIYSKSGCPNCKNVKDMLINKKCCFEVIDCDDFLIEDKNAFLLFIKELANKEVKQFPIIFNNGTFIGGFIETQEYVDKLLSFGENLNF